MLPQRPSSAPPPLRSQTSWSSDASTTTPLRPQTGAWAHETRRVRSGVPDPRQLRATLHHVDNEMPAGAKQLLLTKPLVCH